MNRFRSSLWLLPAIIVCVWAGAVQANERTEVRIPNLPGYITLKGDFHMHTYFSDGAVAPEIRVEEAWRDGLDAIAITDHVEHQTRKGVIDKTDQNRPYEIAKPVAAKRHILLLRGCEITRDQPQGHMNAIGLKDVNAVNRRDAADAVRAAFEQGAFIFWNHPPAVWSEVQQGFLEKGWLQGIEVFNGRTMYSQSQTWCIENNLTMMSNSDVHDLLTERFDLSGDTMRNMTFVFAETRTGQSLLDALRAGRTLCYSGNMLAGRREYLEPFFFQSLVMVQKEAALDKREEVFLDLRNDTSLPIVLQPIGKIPGIALPARISVSPMKTAAVPLIWTKDAEQKVAKEVKMPFQVRNWFAGAGQPLEIEFALNVLFP